MSNILVFRYEDLLINLILLLSFEHINYDFIRIYKYSIFNGFD